MALTHKESTSDVNKSFQDAPFFNKQKKVTTYSKTCFYGL